MTAPSEHEAYLRRALHAAADSLEPRDDGLERITSRLRHARPKALVWLAAAWDALRLRAPAGVQDLLYGLSTAFWTVWNRVGSVLSMAWDRCAPVLATAWDRFAPAPAPGRHRSSAQGWLRPLTATAVVMFIVAAGTYVAIDISTAVSPSSTNVHSHNGQPGPGHSGGAPATSPSRSGLGSGTGLHSPLSSSPTCSPSPTPPPSSSAPASPSPTPSPTPSTSPSSPGPSASPAAVGAVQLTSFTTVSSTLAKASLTPCPTPSATTQTPQPSTDAGATQANQAGAALVTPPAASPTPVKGSGKHRIRP